MSIKVHPTLPFHRHPGSRQVLTRWAALLDLSCHIGMICRESDPCCRKWQPLNCLECIALEAPRAQIHLHPVGLSISAHYDTPAKLQLPRDVVTSPIFLTSQEKPFQIGDIFGPLIKTTHSWNLKCSTFQPFVIYIYYWLNFTSCTIICNLQMHRSSGSTCFVAHCEDLLNVWMSQPKTRW